MKQARIIISIIFLLVGSGCLAVLASANAGGSSTIGNFLLSSYSFMAYGIPVFYFWFFMIFFVGNHDIKRILWPMLTIIPFMIFTFAIKIQAWDGISATAPMINVISRMISQENAVLLFVGLGILAVVVEIFLFILLFHKSNTENIEEAIQTLSEEQKQEAHNAMKNIRTRDQRRYRPRNNRSELPPITPYRSSRVMPQPQQQTQTIQQPSAQVVPQQPIAPNTDTTQDEKVQEELQKKHDVNRKPDEFMLVFHKKNSDKYTAGMVKSGNHSSQPTSNVLSIANKPNADHTHSHADVQDIVRPTDEYLPEKIDEYVDDHVAGVNNGIENRSIEDGEVYNFDDDTQDKYYNNDFIDENIGLVEDVDDDTHDVVDNMEESYDFENIPLDEDIRLSFDRANESNTWDDEMNELLLDSAGSAHDEDNERELSFDLDDIGESDFTEDDRAELGQIDADDYIDFSEEEDDVEDILLDGSDYHVSNNEYDLANNDYNAPSDEYDLAHNDYNAPSDEYDLAHNDYNAPSDEYDLAHNDYNAPSNEYDDDEISGEVVTFVEEKTTDQKVKVKKKRRGAYKIPIVGLLDPPPEQEAVDETVSEKIATLLEETLQEFNIDAKVTAICRGPVVTMFEILPAPGVRLRRIVELSDNLALRLAAPSIRIVAPIPGKEAVGIEVPNRLREVVAFSELVTVKKFLDKEAALPVVLGKNISNEIQIVDLSRMPHLLIAGATGSGKSVCVNAIITSLLYRCSPDEVKLILIDPKIVELSFYNDIGHLLTPVISDAAQSLQALRWCVEEMERRYRELETLNVREIRSYNKKLKEKGASKMALPFIVVVIDEFADLMMTCGKEIETLVSRLTAKSRAVGIHLVVATQRPSTDVITGLIKSNIPTRIAFMVTSKTDSRIILDMNGAENLLGKGDMLYSSASDPFPERIQGPYLSEDEVQKVVDYIREFTGEPDYISDEIFSVGDEDNELGESASEDPLWESAIEEVVRVNKASASHLQRRFKIGYNRAARLVEDMELKGIIGPQQGSKPREVYAPVE